MSQPKTKKYEKPTHISGYPVGTCFEAGHLVETTASWRSLTPKFDETRCTGCLLCYLVCPEGVIYKANGVIAIDYDFCKGCGICALECKAKALRMISVHV